MVVMANKRHKTQYYVFSCVIEKLKRKTGDNESPFESTKTSESNINAKIHVLKNSGGAAIIENEKNLVNGGNLIVAIRNSHPDLKIKDFADCLV